LEVVVQLRFDIQYMSISVHKHICTLFMVHTPLRYMRSVSVHGAFRYISRSVHWYITTSIYKVAFKWREGMCTD